MNKLDEAIRKVVSKDDAELLEKLTAQTALPRQMIDTFRGQFGFLNILGSVVAVVMFGAGVFCAWRFATATAVQDMLTWGALAAVAIASVILIKIWFWMELQRHAIVREIKRLEFQVACLAANITD
jgi:hypothetical protein